MKETLKELWHGNLNPYEEYTPQNEEIKELKDFIKSNYKRLLEITNDEQKGVLNAYTECIDDMYHLYMEEFFCKALVLE